MSSLPDTNLFGKKDWSKMIEHSSNLNHITPIKVVTFFASFLIALFSLFFFFFPEISPAIAVLVTGFILTGIPHGALDIFLMRKIFNSSLKMLLFGLLLYLTLAIPVILTWTLFPTMCFIFFLIYSLAHFADSDIQSISLKQGEWWIQFFSRFSLPFSLSFIFYRSETSQLVSWVHADIKLNDLASVLFFLGIFSLAFVVINTYLNLKLFLKAQENLGWSSFEPLFIAGIFILLPPLYAFSFYFCLVHSVKHIFNVFKRTKIDNLAYILPYWLIPLLGLPVIFSIYSNNSHALDQKTFQYIIIMLSGLALPHSLLIRYAKKRSLLN